MEHTIDDIINDTEKNIDSVSNNDKETDKETIIENEEKICSICLENMDNDKNLVITECKHKYHFSCLLSHITTSVNTKKNLTCPICRGNLNNKKNTDSNITDNNVEALNALYDFNLMNNISLPQINLLYHNVTVNTPFNDESDSNNFLTTDDLLSRANNENSMRDEDEEFSSHMFDPD